MTFGSDQAAAMTREEAVGLVDFCLGRGIRYFDTAPMYGLGEGERRYGAALRGVTRDRFTISSKVGRLLMPADPGWRFDFSKTGVISSFESSLARLGLDRIDIVYVHDPDGDVMFSTDNREYYDQALTEALPALLELRDSGKVGAIGVGMNQWEMELRFARDARFDCFLLAGRYTLLDQSALADFLPFCVDHQISVLAGGPFNSGILATGTQAEATFNYRRAPAEIMEKVRRVEAICDRIGVPLKAAALQFILAHPAIASVIPGARSVAELEDNIRMTEFPIPLQLWTELKEADLIHHAAPIPIQTMSS